jgi:hypothetical protein
MVGPTSFCPALLGNGRAVAPILIETVFRLSSLLLPWPTGSFFFIFYGKKVSCFACHLFRKGGVLMLLSVV